MVRINKTHTKMFFAFNASPNVQIILANLSSEQQNLPQKHFVLCHFCHNSSPQLNIHVKEMHLTFQRVVVINFLHERFYSQLILSTFGYLMCVLPFASFLYYLHQHSEIWRSGLLLFLPPWCNFLNQSVWWSDLHLPHVSISKLAELHWRNNYERLQCLKYALP